MIDPSQEGRSRLRVAPHASRIRKTAMVPCPLHLVNETAIRTILLLFRVQPLQQYLIYRLILKSSSFFAVSSQSSSYGEEDRRIYPGRWPRRLFMLLRLVWSTAVVKYYTAVWGYSTFLIVLMLVGFRTPESSSGWNYFHDFPAELIIWAYGTRHPVTYSLFWRIADALHSESPHSLGTTGICFERAGISWLVQEYYELCNRYRSMTFLPDSAVSESRGGHRSDRGSSILLALGNNVGYWPWQTNRFARIKGVVIAHYNDPWNLLDLTIVVFIFWHCVLSTAWSDNWETSQGMNGWLDLRPTRTEASTRPVLGMTAILAWFRCLGLMKVHPKLGPMVTITLIMFGNILQVYHHFSVSLSAADLLGGSMSHVAHGTC
eukprot:COSAG02_NODE_85_length_39411_cov_50.018493_12_plen_376_part_00